MSPLSQITPLILTCNETANLARTLGRLQWAHDILLIDSFSTDDTLEIARSFPQTRVLQRRFDSFAHQTNFGLQHIRTPWVLSLDADYLVSEPLIAELGRVPLNGNAAGYQACFRYWILGKPLRTSLYPPRTVLFRREQATYVDEGHSHRVCVDGPVHRLSGWIDHDDRKSLDRWLLEQNRYAIKEAHYLLNTPRQLLNFRDQLRCGIFFAPFLVGAYTLFGKRLVLQGRRGWFYTFQRVLAETLLSLRLIERARRVEP